MSVASDVPSRRHFSLAEIRKATDDFNESKIIGEGGFGSVYKGVIVDEAAGSTLVAVKRLNPESSQGIGEFETEIKLLSKSTHCNLVHLVGYCNEHQEMILVYEYMSRGNLSDHLYMNNCRGGSSILTWEQRLKICIGAARGLDYLHTGTGLSERIIHLDIKSDNILLDDNFDAKIADLGLSRKGPANQQNSEVNTSQAWGTPAYVDPQFLKTHRFSRKADVYSFGVVLLEVLTGTSAWGAKIIPRPGVMDRDDWIQHHISSGTLDQIIDSRVVTQIQHESLKRFAYTASKTLQHDPEKRPSMSSVVAHLESALEFQRSSHHVVEEDNHFDIWYDGVTTARRISSAATAQNVFGEPIGDDTMLEMRLDSTRENKAKVAYEMMEHNNKYDTTLRFLHDQSQIFASSLTTLCMLYNATGETLTYVMSRNKYGNIGPSQYPLIIHNGQWGAYIHKSSTTFMSIRSAAAVVYRGKYSDNAFCDRMITWSFRLITDNAAYCEINEAGYFDNTDWDKNFKIARRAKTTGNCSWKNCYTMVNMEDHSFTPLYKVVFTYADIPTMGNTNGTHETLAGFVFDSIATHQPSQEEDYKSHGHYLIHTRGPNGKLDDMDNKTPYEEDYKSQGLNDDDNDNDNDEDGSSCEDN